MIAFVGIAVLLGVASGFDGGWLIVIIDLVAPFGHLEQVLEVLAHKPEIRRVRTLWHNRLGTRYRIIEWSRDSDGAPIQLASYGVGQFARQLENEAA